MCTKWRAVKDLALSAYPDLVRGGILVNLEESIVVGHITISLVVVVGAVGGRPAIAHGGGRRAARKAGGVRYNLDLDLPGRPCFSATAPACASPSSAPSCPPSPSSSDSRHVQLLRFLVQRCACSRCVSPSPGWPTRSPRLFAPADMATRKQAFIDTYRQEMALTNAQELMNVCLPSVPS